MLGTQPPNQADKTATVMEVIADLFHQHLNVDVTSVDTDLIEEGLLDSLMLVELLMHLEQNYKISITIEDLEFDNFRTIRSIESFISARRST